jgi:DNA-binding CsgD family transcriptional regulator
VTENQFSVREQDVIASLMQGKSNKEIALALGIANRTVEYHLGNIYAKLGVTSRTEAVIKLSEYRLWKSTGEAGTTNQGNPQLNKVDNGVILTKVKVFYHPYRSRRNSMKTFVRISVFVLAAILLVTLIIAAFSLLRQAPNSLVVPTISTALIGYTLI